MELTSKQRKHLESLAHELDPVVRIGKNGITPTVVNTVQETLQARELIKVKLLETAPHEKMEVAVKLMEATKCTLVRVIGNIIVLYRQNLEKKYHISLDGKAPDAPVKKAPAKKRKVPARGRPSRPSTGKPAPRKPEPDKPVRTSPWETVKGPRQAPDIGEDPFTEVRPPREEPKMRSGPRAKRIRRGGRSDPGGRPAVRPSTRRSSGVRRSGTKPRSVKPRVRRS